MYQIKLHKKQKKYTFLDHLLQQSDKYIGLNSLNFKCIFSFKKCHTDAQTTEPVILFSSTVMYYIIDANNMNRNLIEKNKKIS